MRGRFLWKFSISYCPPHYLLQSTDCQVIAGKFIRKQDATWTSFFKPVCKDVQTPFGKAAGNIFGGVVFGQKSNLWTDLPVEESYQAVKTLYRLDPGEYKKNYDMIVQLLELAPILSSPARKLSLGQRMKADIGMAILHSPRLLYLDKPTIGLDINIKYTIRSFLRQMNQENGVSIFLTSHDLDDIDEICDDAIVLSGGKLFYNCFWIP